MLSALPLSEVTHGAAAGQRWMERCHEASLLDLHAQLALLLVEERTGVDALVLAIEERGLS